MSIKRGSTVVGIFAGAKLCGNTPRIFRKNFRHFYFIDMMLWPHPYQLMATLHIQTKETTLNKKAKKQAFTTTAESSFCVKAFAIMTVSRLPSWAGNWLRRIQHTALDFNNFKASLTGSLVFCIHTCSSRLILLYSDHLEGRQTIENQLVHTGTSSYRCTHKITSSIFILVHFFRGFIFAETGLSTKIMKISTQEKFPTMW